ncbi:Maf family protein [Syntrophorhabdus aromaticivorans]|uniref:dTTP/UTP pyrophosphatase n=1 Tax=Syntrophorhabdus aromaticivorans TaxID=328301 RepID=A0A351U0A8_9BACT|nr:nucleoside triphosphate pyrophosphatase [Syntrophorhabdus aromaticivorans]NLW34931.1 septum formation protein Maf [Syntrophorhabdus aromaticivorans]HBA53389.1 septum formation protein Maf [Syntrophorhabdus aromaticivorans]
MFQVKEGDSIVLASESTRRVDILRTLGISFSIIPPDIDETRRKDETPQEFARRVSYEKAFKVGSHFPDKWVIGADTIVVLKGKVLGKPKNERDAFTMLKTLRGRWHKVITGYCVLNLSKDIISRDIVETRVFVRDMTDEEIIRYIKTSEPLGKAGSYAVQGKGGYMVKEIKGSYTNVVGLPICEIAEALLSLGVLS